MNQSSAVRIIVGLGNPGSEYAGTRHNAGFDVVDLFAEQLNLSVTRKKFGSRIGEGLFEDVKIVLVKPQQYMNCSGQPVATITGFYKVDPKTDLLVISDDLALDPGVIRLRGKGSSGGQKGLNDIIRKLGSNVFARLRVGIGSSGRIPTEKYVLGRPSPEDRDRIARAQRQAVDAVRCWLRYGIEKAMSEYNGRNASPDDGEQ
jgi:PTH1 family peptidyl-tRNA hydrolase